MQQIEYAGWQNCFRLANDQIDLVFTADVGPRIIRCGFVNERNLFAEITGQVGQTGGGEWRVFGGHRLWHAPEHDPRSYQPDNTPITVIEEEGFIRIMQPMEQATYIQKEIDLYLDPDQACVRVVHRLRNHGLWAVELAPWALSVMAPGGVGILPLPPRGSHEGNLLPNGTLTLWAYTDMADARYTFGTKYVLLRQDAAADKPQKIGINSSAGWAAYVLDGFLFAKHVEYDPAATYPDRNASLELFTNEEILEVETLAPLGALEPGEMVEHVETWQLFRDVPDPSVDADVDAHILPLVEG